MDASSVGMGTQRPTMKSIFTLIALLTHVATAETSTVFIATRAEGIYATTLDQQKGTLSAPVLAAAAGNTGFLAKHPNRPILYAAGQVDKKSGIVTAYKIIQNGQLSQINQQPTKGSRLCHISLDGTQQILLGANYGQSYVISYPIQADGSIGSSVSKHNHKGSSVHPKRQTKPHAHSIYSGPKNKFAYAPDLGADKIFIYKIDPQTAQLTPAGSATAPAGAGPRHMKFGRNGEQAYVLNELSLNISVYNYDATTGELNHTQLVNTLPEGQDKQGMTCSEIRVAPNGKSIYCANRDIANKGRDSLSVFKITANGTITRTQTISAGVSIPRNFNIDPSGKWLLVGGQNSNNIKVFQIDPISGQLSNTGQEISVPKVACIEFSD